MNEKLKLKKLRGIEKNLIENNSFEVSWVNPRDAVGKYLNGTIKIAENIYFRFSDFVAAKDFTYYEYAGFYIGGIPLKRLQKIEAKDFETILRWVKSLPDSKAKKLKRLERFI